MKLQAGKTKTFAFKTLKHSVELRGSAEIDDKSLWGICDTFHSTFLHSTIFVVFVHIQIFIKTKRDSIIYSRCHPIYAFTMIILVSWAPFFSYFAFLWFGTSESLDPKL